MGPGAGHPAPRRAPACSPLAVTFPRPTKIPHDGGNCLWGLSKEKQSHVGDD